MGTHLLQLPEEINDSYFAKPKSSTSASKEEEFFSQGKLKPKEAHPEEKAKIQKDVDHKIAHAIKKVHHMSKYLQASWGLSKGQHPHQLVF
jgi:large subunit ribosomal protein L6e